MISVIFGASSYGATAYQYLKNEFDIRYFCDNSVAKQGTIFEGLTVLHPSALYDKNVIISSTYNIEIASQLIEMGILSFYAVNIDGNGMVHTTYINLGNYPDLSINKNKICLICENHSGSNTYAISKLVQRNDCPFSVVYETNKDTEYYYHVFTSGTVVMTHEHSALKNKLNVQLWHGIPLKSLGYMNNMRSKFSEVKHRIWSDYDAIASYSPMYSLLMGACYGIKRSQFYVTGLPRNDFLFISNGKKNLNLLFENLDGKKIMLYAPTFREDVHGFKNGSPLAYIHHWDDMDILGFNHFLSQNNCVLIMKLHNYDINHFKNLPSDLSCIKILDDTQLSENNLDFYELLNGFDILITDYSSVYFDYLLLDRPIIFTPKDLEAYSRDISLLLEPYDFWTPGEKVTTMASLQSEITKILSGNDSYQSKRREITDIFHTYKDGNATKRIVELINIITKKEEDMK